MLDDKDLKNRILESTNDDDIPNFSTAIKQKYLNKKQEKTPWYKKGLFWGLSTPILACGIIAAIIIPNFLDNNEGDTNPPIINVGPHIVGKRNEIAFGVLSANNILVEPDQGQGVKPRLKKDITEDEFKKQMEYLNPYMKTAEEMLSNNLDLNPVMVESTDPNYQYLMQISAQDETLSFFYNELGENNNPKLLNDDEEDDDEEDEEDSDDEKEEDSQDDEEQEYSLEGIFLKNEFTYYVSGQKEVEQGEFELKLNIFEDENKANKIISIEQEIEVENDEKEQSYVYTTFQDNVKQFQAKVSFEQEENELEMEVEILADQKNTCYMINKESDVKFNLEYQSQESLGTISVDIISENIDQETFTYYLYKEDKLNYQTKLPR